MNLDDYKEFVQTVTSQESQNVRKLQFRLGELDQGNIDKGVVGDVNIALLLTGAMGLSSEGGEFAEIVKKLIFQGKNLMMKILNSTSSENLGILFGIGLILVEHWTLTLMK